MALEYLSLAWNACLSLRLVTTALLTLLCVILLLLMSDRGGAVVRLLLGGVCQTTNHRVVHNAHLEDPVSYTHLTLPTKA